MTDSITPEEREHLAGELALGVLQGEERTQALQLSLQDGRFALMVENWRLRLAPLLAAIPSQAPPLHVWHAIERQIVAVNDNPLISRVRFWRLCAIGAGALAASLALVVAMRAPEPVAPLTPTAVSQLARADGKDVLPTSYDAKTGMLHLGRSSLATGGKSPELWIIPDDGIPRSLGLLPSQGTVSVRDDLRPFFKDGAVLAVSLEEASSAPHEAPSSAPILTGTISTI